MIRCMGGQPVDRLLAVAGDIDMRPPTAQQFAGHLTIDFVVLDEQDRHAFELQRTAQRQGRSGFPPARRSPAQLTQILGLQGFLNDIADCRWQVILA